MKIDIETMSLDSRDVTDPNKLALAAHLGYKLSVATKVISKYTLVLSKNEYMSLSMDDESFFIYEKLVKELMFQKEGYSRTTIQKLLQTSKEKNHKINKRRLNHA